MVRKIVKLKCMLKQLTEWKMEWYVRVINIQQPVETHVHTQRNVHKAAMLLLQTVIDTC